MKKKCFTGLFLALSLVLVAPEQVRAADINNSFKEHFVWTGKHDLQRIEAFQIRAMNERGLVFLLLLEPAEGSQIVLYSITDSSSGEMKLRIEDDSSDWWLEYATSWNSSFFNLSEFINYASDVIDSSVDHQKKVTFMLRTKNINYTQTYETDPKSSGGSGFDQEFMESAFGEGDLLLALSRSIPPAVRESIFRLDLLGEEFDFRYGSLIDILTGCLKHAGFKPKQRDAEFVFKRLASELGLGTMTTPEELEFTSRFKSIDNADPLAGWRPEDLFPEK